MMDSVREEPGGVNQEYHIPCLAIKKALSFDHLFYTLI